MTSGKYFNRGVMALDSPYIGHVVRETDDKIVVFGSFGYRFDVPKSKIKVGRNVILNMDINEMMRQAPPSSIIMWRYFIASLNMQFKKMGAGIKSDF